MTPPVAIVGAGPAGLTIAHLLQRTGIPFVLLERDTVVGGRPRAGVVEYRTVELLRREGIPLTFDAENHECEFRTPHDSVVIDYGALTGGRPHYIYPQHLLVATLFEALPPEADVRCGHTVASVHPSGGGVSLTVVRGDGTTYQQACEVVIGCEGSHSPVAAAMSGLSIMEQRYAVRWLASIATAPPLVQRTIYAAHPRGFAGHMRRGPDNTRYYLQVPAIDIVAHWPHDRIRDELSTRIGVAFDGVPFEDVSLVDLRVRVVEPMQQGRLFLAGDAAHLITPAGGKGMNLAIQDAVELAHGLIDRFGPRHDDRRLSSYSATRLPAIWRTQAFSNWFLRVILADPDGLPGLRDGWVGALRDDPLLARWFAHAYAGVDPS
jgi:p-hydroxybenzoate 3-monooxygenase